jgi:hypothetical protein
MTSFSSLPRGIVVLAAIVAFAMSGCDNSANSTPASGTKKSSDSTPAKKADAGGKATQKKAARIAGDRLADLAPMASNPSIPQEPSPFRFADITKEAGIDFIHVSGMNENKNFPTANGSGVAIFDYDGDGKLDLYFATATFLPVGSNLTGSNKLYKNLGGGKFKDVTEASGLGFVGFCHGIIAGDLDNDGDADVFLCNYGSNVLYLNNGNGTFTNVSQKAGIARPGWSTGGALIDYDNDGDLDIYVSNYGEWDIVKDDQFCGDLEKKIRLYCSPRSIRTVKHFFYRNNGDGTFTDVYDQVILTRLPEKDGKDKWEARGRADGHGFGVIAADVNLDGKPDLYVANDMNPNFLFLNRGDGTFEDVSEICGAAFDEKGQVQSGMGTDAEDINGDGLPELFVTNFANEYNTLYQNLGKASFLDLTAFFGLAADSMPWVGWGCALADFDADGWPDVFVTNGHVDDNRRSLGQPIDYEEPPLLHRNINGKRFKLSTRDVGTYFSTKHVGRGAAFGDLDDDGDIDIVINHKDGAPAVLRNDTPLEGNTWIRLQLTGTRSNRDAIGTLIKVEVGPRKIYRQRKGGCSMMATNDGRVLIGLGKADLIDRITLRWPSGVEQVLENVKPGQTLKIVEPKPDAAPTKK